MLRAVATAAVLNTFMKSDMWMHSLRQLWAPTCLFFLSTILLGVLGSDGEEVSNTKFEDATECATPVEPPVQRALIVLSTSRTAVMRAPAADDVRAAYHASTLPFGLWALASVQGAPLLPCLAGGRTSSSLTCVLCAAHTRHRRVQGPFFLFAKKLRRIPARHTRTAVVMTSELAPEHAAALASTASTAAPRSTACLPATARCWAALLRCWCKPASPLSIATCMQARDRAASRPLIVWAFDASKQAFAGMLQHIVTLGLASSLPQPGPPQCAWYLTNFTISVACGVFLLWAFMIGYK